MQSILLCELAPFQNRNTHGAEVVWAGDGVVRAGHVPRLGGRLAFHLKATASVSFKWQMPHRAYGNHAWNGADVIVEILAEARQTRGAHIDLLLWNRHPRDEHVSRIQSRID